MPREPAVGGETATDGGGPSPQAIREMHRTATARVAEGDEADQFVALFVPPGRARVLLTLARADGELTVGEIAETADVDQTGLYRHVEEGSYLRDAGVIEAGPQRGNARTYRAVHGHPVVQVLRMGDTVFRHGVTPDLLDDTYVGTPGDE